MRGVGLYRTVDTVGVALSHPHSVFSLNTQLCQAEQQGVTISEARAFNST